MPGSRMMCSMIDRQTGTMLHPGAQRSEHRKNMSVYGQYPHTNMTTHRGNQATHNALNPSTTWVSPSHGHIDIIPIELFYAKIISHHCLENRGKIKQHE
jgi:hypothetical protein